jgi:hypothetical protein
MANDSSDSSFPAEPQAALNTKHAAGGFWSKLRRFLVFQFKLYVDAIRDFALSFLSICAFVLDLIFHTPGKESYFDRVLRLGRRTERAINLFDQFHPDEQDQRSVDKFIDDVEERIRKDAK